MNNENFGVVKNPKIKHIMRKTKKKQSVSPAYESEKDGRKTADNKSDNAL